MSLASRRQTMVVFNMTGVDIRECGLDSVVVSAMIDTLNSGRMTAQNVADLDGARIGEKGLRVAPEQKYKEYEDVWNRAHKAGMEAGNGHTPTPMIVEQHGNMADDTSPVVKRYYVPQGVCGFAWVTIKGNTSFGRWAKKMKKMDSMYGGGVGFYVHEFGQSMERKEKYAHAFCRVLDDYDAKLGAFARSRLD